MGQSVQSRLMARKRFLGCFRKCFTARHWRFLREDLPPEAARDRVTRLHYGVMSSVVIPLSVGGGPFFGVLAFDSLGKSALGPSCL